MKFGSLFAAAAGIAVAMFVGCVSEVTYAPAASMTTSAAVQPGETMVVHVPEMMCPYACWPAVEKDLAAQPGVLEVELAPQKEETTIDNPKVFVRVAEGFDADAAVESLAEAGFKGSEFATAN